MLQMFPPPSVPTTSLPSSKKGKKKFFKFFFVFVFKKKLPTGAAKQKINTPRPKPFEIRAC